LATVAWRHLDTTTLSGGLTGSLAEWEMQPGTEEAARSVDTQHALDHPAVPMLPSVQSGMPHRRQRSALEDAASRAMDYQVVFEGRVNVRAAMDTKAPILSRKEKCTVVRAVPRGDWVELVEESGYIKMSTLGITLLKLFHENATVFHRVAQGSCQGAGQHPITDRRTCHAAAAAVGYQNMRPRHVLHLRAPGGCSLEQNRTYRSLWFSHPSQHTVPVASRGHELICSSKCSPIKQAAIPGPITTTTVPMHKITSVSPLLPSLFCFCVTRTTGYEPDLVRQQLSHKAGIFGCDDYTVLSNGGKLWLAGNWYSTSIPVPQAGIGDLHQNGVTTNSWLNTEIFMEAWLLIRNDGRFRHHDWTVKADPDAVVFPARMKNLVKPHTAHCVAGLSKAQLDTNKLYFLNCDRSPPCPPGQPKLFGAVEVFSRKALEDYFWSTSKNYVDCKKELPWHGWGEDSFMQGCMDMIGVTAIHQFGWVADKRCVPGECWDLSHAAFHDFKDVRSWFTCWDSGNKNPHR